MNSPASENVKTVALITGASEGIGRELAKCFAGHKHHLILVARSEEKLKRLAGEISTAHGVCGSSIVQDLSDPDGAPNVRKRVQELSLAVDFLVNNAGVGTYGLFAETDLERELRMMQLNMVSLTALTKLFLPEMLKRRQGRILNVASTAAFQPGPLMAVYYASKAYVLSFSEALANELRGTGVNVTALCPGPTESGFQKRANMEDSKLFSGRKIMDAATVARAGYRGLMAGKTVVIPGIRNRLLVETIRFSPRSMVTQIVRNMQERIQ